ncbi:MAG: 16S rRNA (cytosine(1402)-N(4))-methyltransferase RsmH [Rikenellaceae bacterium]
MAETYHIPVMLHQSIDALDINPEGIYVDVTFGGGGHSREILNRLGDKGQLFSFDQDQDTRANIIDDERFNYVESNFRFLRGALRLRGVESVDGILADLGVSSHHFDCSQRGFSFRFDGPLDMRMNQSGGFTAADVVNTYEQERLIKVLREYGELDNAFKSACSIINYRETKPLATINDLIEAVAPATPRASESKYYAKLFQALRIEVNRELEALKMMLEQSLKVLKPGGVLSVITYHSLEDRLVKNFMRSGNFEGKIEKDFYGHVQTPFKLVFRKALPPTPEEIEINSRSRSAKLRAAIKIEQK